MMNRISKNFIFILLFIWVGTAFAQFPHKETFRGSLAPDIVFGGSSLLTAGSAIDANGAGYLRLTNNQANQSGFIRNTQSFPSADGFEVSFEYFTYGGSGADGIVFFLFDPSASSAFQIGGFGGSLGYSPRSDFSLPGMSKAFIGFAFDEFGNFSKPSQGRVGGPGQMSSSVAIRGDGDGTGSVQPGSSLANSNYEFLTGIQTTNSSIMSAIGAGSVFQIAGGQNGRTAPGGTLDPNETGYRKTRIVLENNGLGTGYKINVYVRLGAESAERHLIVDYNYLSTLAPPANLSYGFSSSTAGANNFHEIRNLEIKIPSSVPKLPLLADFSKLGTENTVISFLGTDFYQSDWTTSSFKDPNGDTLSKIQIKSLPLNGLLKLNEQAVSLNQEISFLEILNLSYHPNLDYNGFDTFTWNGADQEGFYAATDASSTITISPVEDIPVANLYWLRVKLSNPSYATFRHAENPYNKSMVSIFQVDDSPATVFNLMYPYLKGGTTAGGFNSPGVKSTDGCGNDLFWNISVACFIHDINGQDLLEQGGNYISWPQLAIVTANGPGLQRGFDYMNHAFGGSAVLQRDRYKQIFLNNKATYDHLGLNPESLVVPDVQIGFRFGANSLGMDVTSQAGPEPLKDGAVPLAQDAFSDQVYAAVQNPYFIRRNHWQETNNQALVAEHKSYILSAFNKSQTKPLMYNWFSHGPGENGTNNFAYYREVIEYMQSLAGDNVIGLSLDQYLGYQKTRFAAEHGLGKMSRLTEDGYLEIRFDLSDLQKTIRHRLISLLIDSDAQIDSISWSENIKTVTFNSSTGLVNVQLNETIPVDPATLAVRPTINVGTPTISANSPNKIRFELDRAVTQSIANAYELDGNTVLSLSEVPNSGGLIWEIVCQNDFLTTDVIGLTYKAELGNAVDIENGSRMLTYSNLPVVNLSEETIPEVEPLAISVRRDSDNLQLATFNTIEEVKTYMNTFNFNTNISIVFNSDSTYSLSSKWTLNYNNGAYTLKIKGKDGLSSYPVIDGAGNVSDIFRVAMSHIRIDRLKLRSGKYNADGAAFGDNYSGALISQQANTADTRYTNLILHQGMRGIRIGAANGTNQPNISDVLIDQVVLTELTGIAIQVGIINSVSGQPESRTNASYTLNNVIIRNVVLNDTKNQELIEASGAKYSGQIQCRGINNLNLQDIVSDQNQRQPYYIVASKNVLIDRCKATNFSLNTGTGYKAAFHIESSELVTIQNSFAQHTFENVYIYGSAGIKLYHNTFDTQQATVRAVSMSEIRLVQDIQGNIIAAKGDSPYSSCIGISFYRGAGYIPTIANDFVSEQNNLFIAASNILELSGLDAGNTPLSVRVAFSTTFANYKSNYSRGQNSVVSPYSSLSFSEINGVYGYLASNSAGRNFVASQISGIDVDLAKNIRLFPGDAGAYDFGAATGSAELSQLMISEGVLSPVFISSQTEYAAVVPNSIYAIKVSSISIDTLATIKVNGLSVLSGNLSDSISLFPGDNLITCVITAKDGITTKTYTININRASFLPHFESFSNSSVSGLKFDGESNAAFLTGGSIDADGEGYLRLTSNSNNQKGLSRNINSFSPSEGLSISFEYFTYGGSGADGLTFFLYDANANPFNPGGFGGSMGYAQSSSSPGLSKAFLGLGLDEFGNFSAPVAGRQGGPGTRPSSVVLRGDGNGAQTIPTNYEYLTGLQTSDAIAMSTAAAGDVFQIAGGHDGRISGGLSPVNQGYRKAKIVITPNEAPASGFEVNVWIIEGSSNGGILHHVINNYNYIPNDSIPSQLNYGFSAGTGGKNNFHEIRNLEIRLPDQQAPPIITDFSKTLDKNSELVFSSEDFKTNYSSPEFRLLYKIQVLSLPDSGTLKLGLNNILVGQELLVADIPQLSYNPKSDYHGTDSFQWNGSDGDHYADSSAKVNFNIRPASILPYSESFKNSTASAMIYGGSPNSAILTAGILDAEGAGYLRLTSNAKSQNGFARNSTVFSMLEGLSFSFEYYTYGGSGADGLTFFLYDAIANSDFRIGAPGGSMGYAQNSSLPGLSKAYLGFGFDEFGNFSSAIAGRQGGPGQRPSSLTIRGDGDGSAAISSNYEYLTGIQTSNMAEMNTAGAGTPFIIAGDVDGRTGGALGLSSSDNGYRKAHIELKPNGQGTGFKINVWLTEGNPTAGIVHHLLNDYSYVGNTLPENISYGFVGSTGGSTNFHEIRNLDIRLPQALEIPTMMTIIDKDFSNYWTKFSNIKPEQGKELNATNLISPNGDGMNDTWIVRNIEFYPGNALRVFNKKGQLVHSASNYNNDWDGKSNGVLLPEDTYYYILDFSNKNEQLKGYISILR